MSEVLRIGLIDADADIRFGRRMVIDSQADCKVVFEEESAADALVRAPEALIDVLVIDHRVRGLDGIALVEKLIPLYHEANSDVPAIILTGPYFSYELLLASIAAGASDLVTLDSESGELLKAIRSCGASEDVIDFDSLRSLVNRTKGVEFDVPDILVKLGTLDDKEAAILEQFKAGLDDDAIARAIDVPKYRVRQAMKLILAKCSLATRAQLFLAINAADGKNG
jgi:DNA-binding NarL/FixJ family response regulator